MAAGEHMAAEIAEQPDVWQRLLDGSPDRLIAVARRIQESRPRFVLLTARGTSDHAALYAKYLVEIVLGLPAGLVSPSTTTVYGARPDLRDVLLLAISQSGGSPDLVQTVEAARTAGALTVAVTNNPGSALDGAAELHLDVEAGVERAVAATKSYTAELLMLYLLVATVAERERTAVRRLPDWGSRVLAEEPRVSALSKRLHPLERLMVTGRGYAYATAREAALKLMETCYISAQAFSGADLMHGPLALVEAEIPILAVTSAGKGGVALRPTLQKLHDAGGQVFCVGSFGLTEGALPDVPLPREVPEEIAPMLEILPFQQLSLSLALARSVDPDAPRGLSKVTETL